MDGIFALIRILCAFIASFSFHITYTSPSKAAPHEETQTTAAGERVLKFNRGILKLIKGAYWAVGAAEILTLIVGQLPPTDIRHRLLRTLLHSGNIDDLELMPIAVVGLFLIVFGSWVRWKCYQTMKDLFTFELSIRDGHRLVTTGPYSVVRHPSYSGLLAAHIGMYCWYGCRGSWLAESGLLRLPGGFLVALFFTVISMAGLVGTLKRIPVEDRELRNLFGLEWEKFANRIRYALLPGVY